MDWILDEVKESIKNQITICENFMEVCNTQIKNYESRYETRNLIKDKIKQCEGFMEVCEMQLKGYKDQFNTDDKNEACNHSFWKASKIRTAYEIKDLKEILQEIDEMMQEEVKQLDEADEDVRINRADACI